MSQSSPPALSSQQISQFESYIQLPTKYRHDNQPSHDIAYLTALHVHTISTIPYENLSLHYSKSRMIDLNPQHLFQKLVSDGRGRGGYCMEVSIMMHHVLRTLGFQSYMAGVRIRLRKDGVPSGDHIGWTHIVSIVALPNGSRYMVDVAFGGDGATKPVPLVHGQIVQNLGSQEVRLVRDHISTQVHRTESSKLWIYQYRNGFEKDWNSFYAFPEFEFLEADFKVMNWYTSTSPESFQRYSPLVVKFLRGRKVVGTDGQEVDEEIVGKRMLVVATVKENLGGLTQVVHECKTEEERVEALKHWFQIVLSEEEKTAIKGHWTELRVGVAS